jgi:hypothetical protein
MGLYKGGVYTGGGTYTWTIFCVSVVVINKYSNSDKQVLSIVIPEPTARSAVRGY